MAKVKYDDVAPTTKQPEQPNRGDYVWVDDDLPAGRQAASRRRRQRAVELRRQAGAPGLSGSKVGEAAHAKGLSQSFFDGGQARPRGRRRRQAVRPRLPRSRPTRRRRSCSSGTPANWMHRAYWGDEPDPLRGATTRPSAAPIGRAAAEPGKWVRLEVDGGQGGPEAGHGHQRAGPSRSTAAPSTGTGPARDPARRRADQAVRHPDAPGCARRRPPGRGGCRKPVQDARQAAAPPSAPQAQKKQLARLLPGARLRRRRRTVFDPLQQQVGESRRRRQAIEKRSPTTLVFKETGRRPRRPIVLKRGEYDQHGEQGRPRHAGVPAAAAARARRRTASAWPAGWSTRGHPLTARVAVNRFWQQCLRHRPGQDGRGLRLAGRAAEPSGAARLAGRAVPGRRLGREETA